MVRPAEASRSMTRSLPRSARCPTAASSACQIAIASRPTATAMTRNLPRGCAERVRSAPDWSPSSDDVPNAICSANQAKRRWTMP